jgi:hypothetical protein
MIAINEARALLQTLVGEPIWGVRRTHGSCFLTEFGTATDLQALPSRHLGGGRSTPARRIATGKWSLLVEHCAWRIEAAGDITSHLDEDHPHMQGLMDRLEGEIVTHLDLDEAALTLTFSGGGVMRLGPALSPDGDVSADQWMLTLPDGRHLALDTRGALSLE